MADLKTSKESELANLREAIADPKLPKHGKYVMLLRLETLPGRMDWLDAVINDKDMDDLEKRRVIFDSSIDDIVSSIDDIVVQLVEATRNSVPPVLWDVLDPATQRECLQEGQKKMLEGVILRLKMFNDTVVDKNGGAMFGTADCARKEN